jgi:hypothetical protein
MGVLAIELFVKLPPLAQDSVEDVDSDPPGGEPGDVLLWGNARARHYYTAMMVWNGPRRCRPDPNIHIIFDGS